MTGSEEGAARPARRVPMADPVREYRELRTEIDAAVARVLDSGRYVLGEAVEAFERAVAGRLGVRGAVGVGSGTDALRLALVALGIGEGDEVVTSPFSFIATATAILDVGATPVFADIDPVTLDLDPAAAAAAIGERTVALLPVHLFGQMADLGSFETLAERHGLALLEDAAQAFGARDGGGRPAGSVGRASCFSFYPTKSLAAAGDAGMVVTDDPGLAARLEGLRNHGRDPSGAHVGGGTNSRLDAIQAAILATKLSRVDEWTERRRAHAAVYDEALRDADGIRPPSRRAAGGHIFHQYTVRATDRDALRARFDDAGVDTAVFYARPLHREPAVATRCRVASSLEEAERASREVLSLPVFAHLVEAELARVSGVLVG